MRCNYLFFGILILSACAAPPPPRNPEMVFQALANAGVPYRRGGESRGNSLDCRRPVAHAYKKAFRLQLPPHSPAPSRLGRTQTLSPLRAGGPAVCNTP